MAADVLHIRAPKEQASSEAIRRKAEADLRRVLRIRDEIRLMTTQYRARLEDRRVRQS